MSKTIGSLFRAYRLSKKLTLAQFGAQFDNTVSNAYLCKVENGLTIPSPEALRYFAAVSDTDLSYLFMLAKREILKQKTKTLDDRYPTEE